MDIEKSNWYLLLKMSDAGDHDVETFLIVDMAALESIDTIVQQFLGMGTKVPRAFVPLTHTMRVILEPEACFLLDDHELEMAMENWEDNNGSKLYVTNRFTQSRFQWGDEVALLLGDDLIKIHEGQPDGWQGDYRVEFVMRMTETGEDVYLHPETSPPSAEFFELRGRAAYAPWGVLSNALHTLLTQTGRE